MDRNNILSNDVAQKLESYGFPLSDDEYATYTDAWTWIWDNTSLKIYPQDMIDGTISMCRIKEEDMTEDVLAYGYDNLSVAIKEVVKYVVLMGLVKDSLLKKDNIE